MKKTLYKALIFWALVFGIVTADKKECVASEIVSISSNTVTRDCLESGSDVSELNAEKRYGSLWTGTDNDVYKISVGKTSLVALSFWTSSTPDKLGWGYNIEVYAQNGTRLLEYKQIKTSVRKTFYVETGIYYVVVKANWAKAAPPPTDDYAIAATCENGEVPSMKGKKISVINGKTVLKWAKLKQVDGYEVQLCKNKRFKKKQTKSYVTVENTYKVPRRFRKGTYYVRIRAYSETLTGKRIYGKFSKIKKIKKKKRKGEKS